MAAQAQSELKMEPFRCRKVRKRKLRRNRIRRGSAGGGKHGRKELEGRGERRSEKGDGNGRKKGRRKRRTVSIKLNATRSLGLWPAPLRNYIFAFAVSVSCVTYSRSYRAEIDSRTHLGLP